MSRTALYARQSASNPGGIARQIEDGIEACRRKGWPEPGPEDIYREDGRSASRFARKRKNERTARPRYADLLAAMEAGEYDRVMMAVEDRTHRQIVELHEFITLCERHGVIPATVGTEYDLADEDQKTMWYIKVRFAEAEIEKLSRRVRRARLQEARDGQAHPGGLRPFGERGIGPKGNGRNAITVAEVEAERELIREAARRVLSGDSLRGIVADWNRRGITGTTGHPWGTRTLRRMLLSPRLAGLRDHHGTLYPSAEIVPVLDRPTWEAVCAVLTDPARVTAAVGGTPRHLLTGLAFCGVCRAKLRAERDRDGEVAYRCPPPSDGGRSCVSRRAELVEWLLLRGLFAAVEGDTWDREAAQHDGPEADPGRELTEQLAADQARLDRLDVEEVRALADDDQRKAAAIATVRAEVEQRMERARARLLQLQRGRIVAAVPRNLRTLWPSYSLDRRRAILAALIERVEVHRQGPGRTFDPSAIKVVRRDRSAADA